MSTMNHIHKEFTENILVPIIKELSVVYLEDSWDINISTPPSPKLKYTSNILISGGSQITVSSVVFDPLKSDEFFISIQASQMKDFMNELNNHIAGLITATFAKERIGLTHGLPVCFKTAFEEMNQKDVLLGDDFYESHIEMSRGDVTLYWIFAFTDIELLPTQEFINKNTGDVEFF